MDFVTPDTPKSYLEHPGASSIKKNPHPPAEALNPTQT